jgi:hypothetical protein
MGGWRKVATLHSVVSPKTFAAAASAKNRAAESEPKIFDMTLFAYVFVLKRFLSCLSVSTFFDWSGRHGERQRLI